MTGLTHIEGEISGIEFLCFPISQFDKDHPNHLLYPSAQESIIASRANLVLAFPLIGLMASMV